MDSLELSSNDALTMTETEQVDHHVRCVSRDNPSRGHGSNQFSELSNVNLVVEVKKVRWSILRVLMYMRINTLLSLISPALHRRVSLFLSHKVDP